MAGSFAMASQRIFYAASCVAPFRWARIVQLGHGASLFDCPMEHVRMAVDRQFSFLTRRFSSEHQAYQRVAGR
jgi:hypothetical protein